MNVVYPTCAGLDVHKKTVVACLLLVSASGEKRKGVRTFGTMTADLLSLCDWLVGYHCPIVAMESTGVYWKPVCNLLEGQVEVLLVNAQHIKAVPDRKTDVKDAEWLAELLQHGLLRPSFIPPVRSGNCAIWPATAAASCVSAPHWSTACRRGWRRPTWACRVEPCWTPGWQAKATLR